MIKSFEPFFNKGRLLDSGGFMGDFARKFPPYFDDITCFDASDIVYQCACSLDTLEQNALAA